MPTSMRAFADVAASFGQIDPEDEDQVEQFFAQQAPALEPRQQAEILEALLAWEGADLEPLKRKRFASGRSEIRLEDSPPVQVPAGAFVPQQEPAEIGEIAGTMALAFASLFFTAGLDVKIRTDVRHRTVELLLGGPDAVRLGPEGAELLASMQRLATILAERSDLVDRVTMRLSPTPAGRRG